MWLSWKSSCFHLQRSAVRIRSPAQIYFELLKSQEQRKMVRKWPISTKICRRIQFRFIKYKQRVVPTYLYFSNQIVEIKVQGPLDSITVSTIDCGPLDLLCSPHYKNLHRKCLLQNVLYLQLGNVMLGPSIKD